MKREIVIDTEAIAGFVKRRSTALWAALLVLSPLVVLAVTKPFTFQQGELTSADKMNENYDTLYERINVQEGELDDAFALLDDLREELMPTSCPGDMVLGGTPGTTSAFCIDKTERGGTSYYNAVTFCSRLGRHVCTQNQFWIGTGVDGVIDMTNNWEWVGDRDDANSSGHLQVIIGGNGATVQSWAWAGQHNNGIGNQPYRCCKGGVSAIFD